MVALIIADMSASPLVSEQVLFRSKPRMRGFLVYGVGTNDAAHSMKVNGRASKTYQTWQDMLKRCYSVSYQASHPAYVGCSVADSWFRFSVFERWMLTQDYKGKFLDKDLLLPGNRVYSATACVFVSRDLNNLLGSGGNVKGEHLLGVSRTIGRDKYAAKVWQGGHPVHLGTFDTPLEAHQAWQRAKLQIIANFPTTDPRIRAALDRRVAQLRDDLANNRITVSL